MATQNISLVLLLTFIYAAAAMDMSALPKEMKEFQALGDAVAKSKIVDQINGKGAGEAANAAANAPTSGDQASSLGNVANMLKSAPGPVGKDKLDKMMKQFKGPAAAPGAAEAMKKGGDVSMLTKMFASAPGPNGAKSGAADILTRVFKRGPPPAAAEKEAASPPPESSGSQRVVGSSLLGVGVVMGFVSFFVAF